MTPVQLLEGSTVADLRKAAMERLGLAPELLKLSYKGKPIPTAETLKELEIYDGSVVNLRVPYQKPDKETVMARPSQELIDFEF